MNSVYGAAPQQSTIRPWPAGTRPHLDGPGSATPGSALLSRAALANTWLDALRSDRLELHAQRICLLNNPGSAGPDWYEVLLRMRDDHGRICTPQDFIAVAERCGLMPEFDQWVVAKALRWLSARAGDPEIRLSINLSAKSVESADMLRFILSLLEQTDIDPGRICFEVTETAAIHNLDQAIASVTALNSRGCNVALDDFGTGACSFAYLRHLNVDFLKIDAGFVRDIHLRHSDFVLAKTIAHMAGELGIATVAEGIEDLAVMETLHQIGVVYGQGFALGGITGLDVL